MDKLIGCCGLACSDCDAYAATIANDDQMRALTAEKWSQMYQTSLNAEDINCLGCNSTVLFSHCNECEIRLCSVAKSHSNCSECNDYSCDNLNAFFTMVPSAKVTLDNMK